MKEKTQLITQLLRSVQVEKDLTYLIATVDEHTAMISIKDGRISYLRFGVFVGVKALASLQSMKVKSFVERQHSLEHPKTKVELPSTQEILQQLCANLPNTLQEYQAQVNSLVSDNNKVATFTTAVSVDNTIHRVRKTAVAHRLEGPESNPTVPAKHWTWVVAVEPKRAEISESVMQTVRATLQEVLGPISNFIYEDVLMTMPPVDSRDDVAHLINLFVAKIDNNRYQQQLLKILKDRLIGIIVMA